jgi:hypothetical protein
MKKAAEWAIRNPFWVTALTCAIFYLLPFKPKPFGDGDYHIGTIQLIDFILNGFSGNVMVNKGLLSLFCYLPAYAVAYPFHSDAVYFTVGVILQCFFICMAVKLLFDAFALMGFSRQTKVLVLVLLCLFPVHVYYAMGILCEAFAFFASAAFVYYWSKIVKGNATARNFAALALSLVMIYGIKPSMLPFVGVCTLYFLFLKFDIKLKFTFAATMLLLPALVLLEKQMDHSGMEFKSAVFRNQILWSRYELRDEPLNWMPQHGHGAFASSDYLNNLKKRNELDSICKAQGIEPTKHYIDWVKNDIVSHPGLTLRQYFLKFFQSQSFIISPLMKSGKPAIVKYGIHIYINLINLILVVFGLLGLIRLFRKKEYRLAFPFLFFWGWCLLYICVFHSEQRYLFVFRTGLIFLAAYYIDCRLAKNAKPDPAL